MHEELEAKIRSHFDAGELEHAATVALEGYGRELLGFLVATMRDEQDARDVFSQVSEDLWRGLPNFGWRSSFRTWSYSLARNAAGRFRRTPHNQRHRRVPLSAISEVANRVCTRALPHLRTEIKDRFAELRQSLDPDDQALLILRVNRRMTWKQIAQVLDAASIDDDAAIDRAAARFRQQFHAVKARMHDLAERDGLLDSEIDAP